MATHRAGRGGAHSGPCPCTGSRRRRADRWRALQRARSEVLMVRLHPAALRRIKAEDASVVGPRAGAERTVELGADLVAVDHPLAEVYVRAESWPPPGTTVAREDLHHGGQLAQATPQGVWPFADRHDVATAAGRGPARITTAGSRRRGAATEAQTRRKGGRVNRRAITLPPAGIPGRPAVAPVGVRPDVSVQVRPDVSVLDIRMMPSWWRRWWWLG